MTSSAVTRPGDMTVARPLFLDSSRCESPAGTSHLDLFAREGDTLRYRYDGAGRLDEITNSLWQVNRGSGRRTWTYSHDAKGRLTNLALPTSTAGTHDLNWEYDADDRITRYWQVNGGPNDRLARNALGQVTTHVMWGGNRTDNFEYDGLGRLKYRTSTHSATEPFTYDPAGNRLTDARWTLSYNDRGQLTRKTDGSSCVLNYGYDDNGNLLSQSWQTAPCSGDLGRTITYDAGDRMVTHQARVTGAGGTRVEERTYWYDGLGRRILAKSDDSLAVDYGYTRYWWLDANVAVKTWNVPTDPDLWWPSMTRHSNGVTLIGEGEWFYSGPGADQHLGSWNHNRDNTRRHLFIADYRGSVVRVMKPDGVALGLSASSYTAFGSGENAPASAAKNPGYNGLESSGGLLYMRNRWYDPNSGRFTQEDPIGFAGGINLYGYVGNNPVTFSDPFGLCPIPPSSCGGRQGADLALGSTPVVSTLLDAATVVSGKNVVTGEDASRLVALAGLVSPAGGGQLRAGGKILDGLGDVAGGSATARQALDGAVKWLGEGYTEFRKNIFRSADGSRQFRMQPSDLTSKKQGPHVHFESIGPDGRKITENSHVKLEDQ